MYPPNLADPEFLRRSENYWFYGIVLSSMCYGLNFALAISSMRLLLSQTQFYVRKHSPPSVVDSEIRSRARYSFAFTFLLFGFATASIIPVIIVGKSAYSGAGNPSSGPAQYLVEHVFQNVTTLRVAYVLSIICNICTSLRLVGDSTPLSSDPTPTMFVFLDQNKFHSAEVFSGRVFLPQGCSVAWNSDGYTTYSVVCLDRFVFFDPLKTSLIKSKT
jgi:hypothetical protein